MITRTASELAELCGAALEGDGAKCFVGPAPLAEATRDEVSFLDTVRYAPLIETTSAGCVLVLPRMQGLHAGRWPGRAVGEQAGFSIDLNPPTGGSPQALRLGGACH